MAIFQSTPPVKAATGETCARYLQKGISIHAAREGGDRREALMPDGGAVFQSTPPVKAATRGERIENMINEFQSTPPVKAATAAIRTTNIKGKISIHAAREGGDLPTRL